MANADDAAAKAGDDTKDALKKQVTQLKREITRLNKQLADRVEDVVEDAGGWYDTASDRASRATQALRSRAQTVSETVKENPGTVSSAMLLGGAVGLLLGLLLGQGDSRRHW
jgi:hypothetical protein